MSDREALAAALEIVIPRGSPLTIIEAAARERLAQLPERCEHDNLDWQDPEKLLPPERCPTCHGSGKVYPADSPEGLLADIVQKATPYGTQDGDFIASYLLPTGPIHRALKHLNEHGIPTVAVLDALNGKTP